MKAIANCQLTIYLPFAQAGKNYILKALLLSVSLLIANLCFVSDILGQSQTFTSSGTFIVPVGVNTVTVEAWGGGGAGGGVNGGIFTTRVGGGGAGGTYTKAINVSVNPGQVINVSVGAGGTGVNQGNGNNGGTTIFASSVPVSAVGGGGGKVGDGNDATGAGGALATGITFNGGKGADAIASASGGGGGGAGNTGSGSSASGVTGGAGGSGGGGAGANGRTNTGDGNDASALSGGGSGGRSTSSADRTGGDGFRGQVVVSYTQLTFKSQFISMDLTEGGTKSATSWCAGETRNVKVTVKNIGTATWDDVGKNINIGVKWNASGSCVGNPPTGSWCDYYVRTDAASLAPGATITYTLPLTASNFIVTPTSGYSTPLSAGINNITFDIVYEGISWFGDNGGGVGPGNTTFISVNLNITVPTANAGAALAAICQGGTSAALGGSVSGGATGGIWSDGGIGGTFSPNATTLNATWKPPVTFNGTVTLTLTTTGGSCGLATASKTQVVDVPATAVVGVDQTICSGSTLSLAGSRAGTGVTASTWSTSGTGTFSSTTNLNTVYTPSAADRTTGSVVLTLTTNDPTGPCGAGSDQMTVTVNPLATVNAGADQTICSSPLSAVTLSGSRGGGASSATWSGGAGTFAPNNTALNATYTPSAAEFAAGSNITLTLTTNDPAGPCNAVSDQMVITINVAANADAGADQTICSGSQVSLSGARSGTGVTSSTWTTSGSGTFVNAASLATTYTPSAADITAGAVTLTLTTNDPAGACIANADQMVVTINASATANAGANQSVCSGATTTLSGIIGGSAGSATWSAPGGSFSNPSNLSTVYTPSITSGSVLLTLTTNDPDGAGPCPVATSTITVSLKASPTSIVATPVSSAICTGSSVNLTGSASISSLVPALVLSENFNTTSSFGTSGTSTGDRSQIWQQETSGTNVNSVATFSSIGGGKLMVATAGSSSIFGGSSVVSSSLTSGIINTTGFASLSTLTFNHTYKQGNSSGSGAVQVSTNGGSTWTTLGTFTNNQGSANNFETESFGVSAYVNSSNFRIRFLFNTTNQNFFSNNTSWWAIDDVVISGTIQPSPQFSWTASPVALPGLPNNANITVSPTVTTNYTLTATDAVTGCSTTASPAIVTVFPVPGLTAPANASLNTSDDGIGNCSAVHSWTHPGVNTACPTTLTVAYTAGSPAPSNLPAGGIVVAGGAASETFFAGVTTVTYTATDQNNNTASTSFTVTIADNEMPVINCAADVLVSNTPGKCDATVILIAPSTSDNCGVESVINDHPSNIYPLGTTDVIWTVKDVNNNTSTCIQKVTVNDTEIPTITCASDVSVNNDAGQCSAIITLTAPASGDNCSVASVTNDHSSSNVYPVGTTIVKWTVTDASGNTASCDQTVTVTDNEKPVITCPAPVTTVTDPAASYATITLQQPVVTDNCGSTITVVNDHSSAQFPIGPTIVTWTATDIHGNVITCEQTILVNDIIDPAISINPPIGIFNTPANCDGSTDITYPVASDNSGHVTVTSNYPGLPTPSVDPVSPLFVPLVVFPVGQTTITWTAVDPSLNDSWSTQTVTVTDNEKPTITCPADINQVNDPGLCSAEILLGTPVTADNCGVASVSNDHPSTVYPVGVTMVTWTVLDIHGNTNTCVQKITVTDNEAPTIVCASDVIVNNDLGQCSASITLTPPALGDNCGVASITNDHLSVIFNKGQTIVLWTVTDIYGNTSTCTQTVTVTDNELPVVTAAPDVITTTSVDGAGNCTASVTTDNAVFGDNCPGSSIAWVMTGATSGNGVGQAGTQVFNKGLTTITYTATDAVGNISLQDAMTVTVNDDELPVLSPCPASLTLQALSNNCFQNYSWAKPTFADNCPGTVLTVSSNNPTVLILDLGSTSFASFPVGVTIVTYLATDASGNTAACNFTISVQDVQNPTITGCPANITINNNPGLCSQTVYWNPPTASDNCSGVILETSHIPGTTFPVGVTTVTYTATDAVGNTTVCSFTVTVADSEIPTITAAADVAVNNDLGVCEATVILADPTTGDNCGVQSISNDHPSATYPVGTTIVTWTVTDIHGNTNTATQQVVVTDNEIPTFTRPADITIFTDANCGYDASVVATGDVTDEHDNCTTGLEATYTDVVTNGTCEGNKVITRTWHLTDSYSNAAVDQVQTITVLDYISPAFTRPADITIYSNTTCVYDASVTSAGDVINEADNCSTGLQATFTDVVTDGPCEGSHIITRTWSLVDHCGNQAADQVQIITVSDNTVPTFNRPADITIYTEPNCSYNASLAITGDVINEADNCSTGIEATFADVVSAGVCQGSYIITRIWSLVDNCGNAAAGQVQTITISDNTAPTFSIPADITIYTDANCNYDESLAITGDVTDESDNCSTGLEATFADVVTDGACEGSHIITRTWSLVDHCGNAAAQQIQIITVEDNIAPTFNSPAHVTLFKEANCLVNDTPTGLAGDVINEADNCSSGLNATFSDAVVNNCEGTYTITRTWSLVDNCGNVAADQVQIITVKDNIAPTFTAPADVTLYKDASCNVNDTPTGLAGDVINEADNCSTGLNATFSDAVVSNCEGTYTITRTWSLVDNCGNAAANQVQIITVKDNIAPTFTAPADVTLYKDAGCNVNDTPTGLAGDVINEADNCSTGLNATFSDAVVNNCQGTYTITRTWSLIDNCSNAAGNQVQIITVMDKTAPTFTVPVDITLFKDASCNVNDTPTGAAGDVTNEADNCSTGLNATYSDVVVNNCQGTYTITRTWSLVDKCGNAAANQVQTMTVKDNIAPTFTAPPNKTLYKDANCLVNDTPAGAAGDVTNEADNCSTGLNATFSDVVTTGSCQGTYTITRTWSLVDNCGNSAASQIQTIAVSDNTVPTFTRPANKNIYTTANCTYDKSVAVTGDVTNEADNCSTGLQATYSDVETNGTCVGNKTITRTWNLIDNCGNAAASQAQIITVLDNIAPIISTCAPSVTVVPNFTGCTSKLLDYRNVVVATDNCSVVTLTQSPVAGTALPLGANTVTIIATDACGNSSSCSFTVTVNKTLDMVLTNSNPQLYYGYTLDQSTVISAKPTGGVGPYKVVITMNRPLGCNAVNSAGDEIWLGGTGTSTSTGTTCPASGTGAVPVSTANSIAAGGTYSVTTTLMANATISVTITDANGCTVTKTTFVSSEDARCFAGNSGNAKVKLCHMTGINNDKCHELCVAQSAVAAHLAHGDFLGSCTTTCIAPPITYSRVAIQPLFAASLEVRVMPNPTPNFFNVVIKGTDAGPVTVRVMDVYGRVLQVHQKIGANATLRMGQNWTGGAYFVEVSQGNERKVVKVIKAN